MKIALIPSILFACSLTLHARVMSPDQQYHAAVIETRDMISDARARKMVEASGLQILNVTWEDTGRYKDSAGGPNIGDTTGDTDGDQESKKGDTARQRLARGRVRRD